MKKQKVFKSVAEMLASAEASKKKKKPKKKSKGVSGPAQDPAIGSGGMSAGY